MTNKNGEVLVKTLVRPIQAETVKTVEQELSALVADGFKLISATPITQVSEKGVGVLYVFAKQ